MEKLHRALALVSLANHVVAGIVVLSAFVTFALFRLPFMIPFSSLAFAFLAFSFAQIRWLCPLMRWKLRLFLFSTFGRTAFMDAR